MPPRIVYAMIKFKTKNKYFRLYNVAKDILLNKKHMVREKDVNSKNYSRYTKRKLRNSSYLKKTERKRYETIFVQGKYVFLSLLIKS